MSIIRRGATALVLASAAVALSVIGPMPAQAQEAAPETPEQMFARVAADYALWFDVDFEEGARRLGIELTRYHHPYQRVDRWFWDYVAAGFDPDEWALWSFRICRESDGNERSAPNYGRYQPRGLLQILGRGRTSNIGILRRNGMPDLTEQGLLDGPTNLRAAKILLDISEGNPWAISGRSGWGRCPMPPGGYPVGG